MLVWPSKLTVWTGRKDRWAHRQMLYEFTSSFERVVTVTLRPILTNDSWCPVENHIAKTQSSLQHNYETLHWRESQKRPTFHWHPANNWPLAQHYELVWDRRHHQRPTWHLEWRIPNITKATGGPIDTSTTTRWSACPDKKYNPVNCMPTGNTVAHSFINLPKLNLFTQNNQR